jgi:hypothetical protein
LAVGALELARRLVARTRIGLDLEHDSPGTITIRAVAARGAHVCWRREEQLSADQPLSTTLASFLRSLPGRHWPRLKVVIALGPASVQLKRLPGLPALGDPKALAALVSQNASRFFLRNGIPIATSALRVEGPGDAWGAAVEQPLLDSLGSGCLSARFRLRSVVPAAAVLGPALAQNTLSTDSLTVVWPPGSNPATRQALTYAGGRLENLRPMRHLAPPGLEGASGTSNSDVLAALDWPYAAAYGAAIAGYREPVAWRRGALKRNHVSPTRLRIAAATCAFASIVAIASPGFSAMLAGSRATHHLRAIGAQRQATIRALDSLTQLTAALREAASFADRRHSVTTLLASLAHTLPTHSAIIAFHVDTSGGTLVALAPNASALLSSLEHVAGISEPEIVGPVTSELLQFPVSGSQASAQLPSSRTADRLTVRFKLSGTPGRVPSDRGTASPRAKE